MKSEKMIAYGEALQTVEEENPVPQGTEVLVRISHCGVCHSDVHVHEGYFALAGDQKLDVTGNRELPFTMGHEIQGEVAALGPDATGITVGEKCLIFPWIGCGKCGACERGYENHCEDTRNIGLNIAGGFSDYVIVPHARYLLDPAGIPDGLAATYMCSGLTAYSAVKNVGKTGKGDPVLILGLGGVGLIGLQVAKALLDGPVYAVDLDNRKLAAATEMGADGVFNSGDGDVHKAIFKATGGIYSVVDFVGSEAMAKLALRVIRRGGKYVLVGLFGGGFSMPTAMFPLRAISVIGSLTGTLEEAKEVLELARGGKIAPIPIEERPMDQASQSLQDLRDGAIVGRVVLTP
ncbi:MAG: alcohol dehydrogenase [Proteobacteria bacterium]|nr:alcohol dehydrogenase [Pseudomonadota bacterium]